MSNVLSFIHEKYKTIDLDFQGVKLVGPLDLKWRDTWELRLKDKDDTLSRYKWRVQVSQLLPETIVCRTPTTKVIICAQGHDWSQQGFYGESGDFRCTPNK